MAVTAQRGTVECQAHLLTYSDRPRESLVKALYRACVCVLMVCILLHSNLKAMSSPMQLMTGCLKDMHNFQCPTVIEMVNRDSDCSTTTVSLRVFKTRVPCESARTMKQMSSSTDRQAADLYIGHSGFSRPCVHSCTYIAPGRAV